MTITPAVAVRTNKVSNLNGNRVKRVAIELNNSRVVCPRLPLDAPLGVEEHANMDAATARHAQLLNQAIQRETPPPLSPDILGSRRTLGDGRLGQFSSTTQLEPTAQELSHCGLSLQSITVDSPQIIQQQSQRVRTPRTMRLLAQR